MAGILFLVFWLKLTSILVAAAVSLGLEAAANGDLIAVAGMFLIFIGSNIAGVGVVILTMIVARI